MNQVGGVLKSEMKQAYKELSRAIHQAEPDSCFAMEFWDGDRVSYGSEPVAVLRLRTPEAARRILGGGLMGFGEAYMAGEAEVEGRLDELLRLGLAVDYDRYQVAWWKRLRYAWVWLKCRNTCRRSPKNIAHHYDLGNDFYALYLDRSMTYSCAYFESHEDSLEQAQQNKYRHIARKLRLRPDESLLDIGCGWGGMLIYAAREFGVHGVGVTLSPNQQQYAQAEVERLGLSDRIKILLQDYRDLEGNFDKLVSIGMYEHVGRAYQGAFMAKAAGLLKPGGLGLLHTIGKDAPDFSDPWIQKYIFPGGYLPTMEEISREMGKRGLSIIDVENLRMHYALTLERWAQNFERNLDRVREKFKDSFVRCWRLFLQGSAAGFRYGDSRLFQILFSNGLNNNLPLTRDHLYRKDSR